MPEPVARRLDGVALELVMRCRSDAAGRLCALAPVKAAGPDAAVAVGVAVPTGAAVVATGTGAVAEAATADGGVIRLVTWLVGGSWESISCLLVPVVSSILKDGQLGVGLPSTTVSHRQQHSTARNQANSPVLYKVIPCPKVARRRPLLKVMEWYYSQSIT